MARAPKQKTPAPRRKGGRPAIIIDSLKASLREMTLKNEEHRHEWVAAAKRVGELVAKTQRDEHLIAAQQEQIEARNAQIERITKRHGAIKRAMAALIAHLAMENAEHDENRSPRWRMDFAKPGQDRTVETGRALTATWRLMQEATDFKTVGNGKLDPNTQPMETL